MEKVLKSLNEANERLNFLIKSTEEKESALVAKLDLVIKKQDELDAREEAVADREAEVAKYGAVEKAHADLGKLRGEVSAELAKAKSAKEDLEKKVASVELKQKELDEIVAIYKKNMQNCADERKKLEDDRKVMKEQILEQLSKGLK